MPSAQDGLNDESFDILRLSVISSTPIIDRVTAILDHLGSKTYTEKPTPRVVLLAGKPGVSNKAISIVEIAKRELASQNITTYQYTKLTLEKTTIKSKSTKQLDDDNDAFETMAAPDRTHDAPVLFIYLSDSSIDNLKKQFG